MIPKNKKRQEPLFKAQTIVKYFKQPRDGVVFYADDVPYETIGNRRVFGEYRVVRAEIIFNPKTRKYKYKWHCCKVVKV